MVEFLDTQVVEYNVMKPNFANPRPAPKILKFSTGISKYETPNFLSNKLDVYVEKLFNLKMNKLYIFLMLI